MKRCVSMTQSLEKGKAFRKNVVTANQKVKEAYYNNQLPVKCDAATDIDKQFRARTAQIPWRPRNTITVKQEINNDLNIKTLTSAVKLKENFDTNGSNKAADTIDESHQSPNLQANYSLLSCPDSPLKFSKIKQSKL